MSKEKKEIDYYEYDNNISRITTGYFISMFIILIMGRLLEYQHINYMENYGFKMLLSLPCAIFMSIFVYKKISKSIPTIILFVILLPCAVIFPVIFTSIGSIILPYQKDEIKNALILSIEKDNHLIRIHDKYDFTLILPNKEKLNIPTTSQQFFEQGDCIQISVKENKLALQVKFIKKLDNSYCKHFQVA
ncbi:MAG: hypothetical protein J6W29_04840 [Neisseriaceae bacterium]|nr:hypothetical protein [Neisseriaceae bacterium]